MNKESSFKIDWRRNFGLDPLVSKQRKIYEGVRLEDAEEDELEKYDFMQYQNKIEYTPTTWSKRKCCHKCCRDINKIEISYYPL